MTYQGFLGKVVDFLAGSAKVSPDRIQGDTNLIGSGIVDSLMLTELIIFVEDALNCSINVENFRLATFESINSIYSAYAQ